MASVLQVQGKGALLTAVFSALLPHLTIYSSTAAAPESPVLAPGPCDVKCCTNTKQKNLPCLKELTVC